MSIRSWNGVRLLPETVFSVGFDFRGANLYGIDLNGSTLIGANFYGCDLSGANLTRCNLTNAIFTNAILHESILIRSILRNANLEHAVLTRSNLEHAQLYNANLLGARLLRANLEGAVLTRATLVGAILISANLVMANIDRADLRTANLANANLSNADLTFSDLGGVNLNRANLTHANLSGADLRGLQHFNHCIIRGANFTQADIDEDTRRDIVIQSDDSQETIGLIRVRGRLNRDGPLQQRQQRQQQDQAREDAIFQFLRSIQYVEDEDLEDPDLDVVSPNQPSDVEKLEKYHNESCFDVINLTDEVIGDFLSDPGNLVIFYRHPGSDNFFANCLTFDTLKKYLKDPEYIFYSCVEGKDFRTYHTEAPQYLKIPGRTTIFVRYDVIKRKYIERQNMIFLEFEMDINKTITYSASNTMRFISSNHCQDGSDIPLYNIIF